MNNRYLVLSPLLLMSSLVIADSHMDAALQHVRVTDLKATFEITRIHVLANLESYQSKLLNSPSVKGNKEAEKLTREFIGKAGEIVQEVYGWRNVEALYVRALKETYSEDELIEINKWLSSKYGEIFIEKQHKFMHKTIDINNHVSRQFQQRVRGVESEYLANVKETTR